MTFGAWRSPVAHSAGGRGVAGSNPVAPTIEKAVVFDHGFFCLQDNHQKGLAGEPSGPQIPPTGILRKILSSRYIAIHRKDRNMVYFASMIISERFNNHFLESFSKSRNDYVIFIPMLKSFSIPVFLFFLLLISLASATSVQSQAASEPLGGIPLSANFSLTNEGISIIPAFGLGEPAVLTSFSAGNRFRFEPEFYFSIKGDPWAFLLWLRYDLLQSDRFTLQLGMHPGYTFLKSEGNGDQIVTEVVKILAGELSARYRLTESLDVGVYYLRGGALDGAFPQESHYLSFNSSLPGLNITRNLSLSILPQVYYLKLEDTDGFYAAASAILALDGFPLTLSSVVNKIIESDITGNPDPLWNISLNYSISF